MSYGTCKKCNREATKRHLTRGLCDACYFTHRSRQVAYGRWETVYTDATETRERIEALRGLGIGFRRIGELTGVNFRVLQGITVGRGNAALPVKKVKRTTEAKVLAVPLPTIRASYRLAAPGARVPITGTRRRLQALMAIGYTQTYLCTLISDSVWGNRNLWTNKYESTSAWIAARVADIFDQLQSTPGPSQRARNWAVKNGWPNPYAWDEDTIDDPAAQPCAGTGPRASTSERIAELHELGIHDINDIAQRLGVQPKSVERQIHRDRLAS
jgi:hypothetical protein